MKALEYKDKDGNWIPLGVINVNDIQCESDVFLLPEDMGRSIPAQRVEGMTNPAFFEALKQAVIDNKRIVLGLINPDNEDMWNRMSAVSCTHFPKNDMAEDGFEFLTLEFYEGGRTILINFYDYGKWIVTNFALDASLSLSDASSPIARTSTPTINAGTQYYNEKDDLTVSNFEGFSSRNKTATILSSKPIKFEGENVLTPVEIPESDYLLYTISYMQTSDIKFVLVVGVEAMKAPQGGLKGEDIETSTK